MAINTLQENNRHSMQLREDIETRDAVEWLDQLEFGLPTRSPVAIGDSIGRGFLQVTEGHCQLNSGRWGNEAMRAR